MKTTFKEINYKSNDWTSAVKLREKVLREPLGSFFTKEELEAEHDHIQIAGFINDTIIATAVLVPEGDKLKMQRVAVDKSLRGKNIGTAMMKFCETIAMERNAQLIYCHARDSAVHFYTKNGYTGIGDYFDEDGIPHLKMSKNILL